MDSVAQYQELSTPAEVAECVAKLSGSTSGGRRPSARWSAPASPLLSPSVSYASSTSRTLAQPRWTSLDRYRWRASPALYRPLTTKYKSLSAMPSFSEAPDTSVAQPAPVSRAPGRSKGRGAGPVAESASSDSDASLDVDDDRALALEWSRGPHGKCQASRVLPESVVPACQQHGCWAPSRVCRQSVAAAVGKQAVAPWNPRNPRYGSHDEFLADIQLSMDQAAGYLANTTDRAASSLRGAQY